MVPRSLFRSSTAARLLIRGVTVFAVILLGLSGNAAQAQNFVPPPPHVNPPASAVTTHPRLLLVGGDLQRLRAWAVQSNPYYADLQGVAINAKQLMDNGTVPAQDPGDGESTWQPYPTEGYAELFAFMSLIEPDANVRADYAQRAHTLLMYVLNQAVLGQAVKQPFRTPKFAIGDRSRWYGEGFPLTVDWIYPSLTAADKATIRKVFLRWVQENLLANVTANEHPQPVGTVNSASLLDKATKIRWAGNNYWCNHARNIGLMVLALDPADDVPAASTDPPAGTLRDFIGNTFGAWLYVRDYAEQHDLTGGIAPEGTEYGVSSLGAISMLLEALHTAGYDDPGTYGPQAGMLNGRFWASDVVAGYVHSMSPSTQVQQAWVGPSYLPAGFGDNQHYEVRDMIRLFGPLALYDMETGDAARLNLLRWMETYFPPGGPGYRATRARSALVTYGPLEPILCFMIFDPNVPAPADTRPTMPTDYAAPGIGRLLSRTDWGPNASWFTYILAWNNIDHQTDNGNAFELWRKGEWLTKERSGYGVNVESSDSKNTLSLQNATPPSPSWYAAIEFQHGSQYSYVPDGDPTLRYSFGGAYTYAQGDASKLYNSAHWGSSDITHASRSILWIKPDFTVVYDRAASKSAGRYKRFFLNTPTVAAIAGNLATVTTPGGQKLFVNTVLPANASITTVNPGNVNGELAELEPMLYGLQVEDPSQPLTARFLHVLQGADSGTRSAAASLVRSTAGTPYDGVLVNGTAVLFANDITAPFVSVTYSVPAGTGTQYITGLTPGGTYTVTQLAIGSTVQVTITPLGNQAADWGGVLVIGGAAGLPTYSISGQVLVNGAGLGGATVTAGNATVQTGGDGSYVLVGVPAGTYSVSASKPGFNFNGPFNVTVGPNQAGINFAGNQLGYSISGQVTANGAALAGATVTAGNVSAQTGADGSYSLAGLPAGTYNVSASKQGYNVNGAFSVTVGPNQNGVNFIANLVTYSITGQATAGGAALAGATVTAGNVSVQTAANSSYTLSGLPAGTYSVSASKAGYNFNGPFNVTVGPSQNGINFAGQAAAAAGGPLVLNPSFTVGGSTVTGTVTLSAPAGAGGVSVPLSSDNAAAVVPASIIVPQGATSANFSITTSAVAGTVNATIAAQVSGVRQTASLKIAPNFYFGVAPCTGLKGGTAASGVVLLALPAPAGGITVTIANTNSAVTAIPASVTVPAGVKSVSFPISTKVVVVVTNGQVAATLGPQTISRSLCVSP